MLDVMLSKFLRMRNKLLAQLMMMTKHPMLPLKHFVTKVIAMLVIIVIFQSLEEKMKQLEKISPHALLMLKTYQ